MPFRQLHGYWDSPEISSAFPWHPKMPARTCTYTSYSFELNIAYPADPYNVLIEDKVPDVSGTDTPKTLPIRLEIVFLVLHTQYILLDIAGRASCRERLVHQE